MNDQRYTARSILQVLHARGISDVALAKQTGIHRVSLNRIRNGKESGKTSLPILNQLIIEKSLTPKERAMLASSYDVETLDTSKRTDANEPEKSGGFLKIKKLWNGYLEGIAESERQARYEEKRLENARKLVERADKRERAKQSLYEIQQHVQPLPTRQVRKQDDLLDDTFDRLAASKRTSIQKTVTSLPTNGYVCAVCKVSIGIREIHPLGYSKGKEYHFCMNCANVPKYQQWLYEHRTPDT